MIRLTALCHENVLGRAIRRIAKLTSPRNTLRRLVVVVVWSLKSYPNLLS